MHTYIYIYIYIYIYVALHYILLRVSAPVGAINVIRTVGALDVGLDEDN